MSPRPDPARELLQRLRPKGTQEGFSLIEVMVAMTLFAVIALSSLTFMVSALGATSLARLESVAKNLGQERLESMRNLRYSVSNAVAGSAADLLDIYYPRTSTTSTATSTSSSGFVAAGDTVLRDTAQGDPATGAFYRTVIAPGGIPGYPKYAQRVAAQFLANDGRVLDSAVFNASSTGVDALPPAATIGVNVTTLWQASGKAKNSSVYSQITNGAPRPPIVTLQARMAALRFSGITSLSREVTAEAGILNLDGSISSSASASAKATAAFAAIAGGNRITGGEVSAAAPPTQTAKSASSGTLTLADGTPIVARLSNSAVSGVSASTTNGQPGTGTATAPVTATLLGGGFGSVTFTGGNAHSTTSRLQLVGDSVVTLDSPNCGGSCAAVGAKGHLASTGGPSHFAEAKGSAAIDGTVQVLPTQFAPAGLLQITMPSASFTCASRAGSSPPASISLTYEVTVRWMTYDPTTGVHAYTTPITLTHLNAEDPLGSVDLATTQVGVDGFGQPLYLGDYLQQWSSLTSGSIVSNSQVTTDGRTATTSVPGVFSITSKALRDEPDSTAGLQLGAISCVAGDLR